MRTTPMTSERKREIKQLWFVANHYLRLSQRIKDRLPNEALSCSIRDNSDSFSKGALDQDQKGIMLLTAHLGSCAIRLNTIEDILGTSISKRLQKYKNLEGNKSLTCDDLKPAGRSIIHFLLRNNIGHYEPHGVDKKLSHNTMEQFLGKLTIKEIFEGMKLVVEDIKGDLLTTACTGSATKPASR